jgi:hypothetical protein
MIKPRSKVFLLLLSFTFIVFSCQHEPDEIVEPGPPDPEPEQCDTLNVTYDGDVYPIFEQYCNFCHSGAAPQGGIDLTNYETVAFLAQSGQLLGAINHDPAYSPMPKDGDKLSFCKIRTITIWVNDTTFPDPPGGDPCDPDTIYFERDLLPLLQSGCAQPGCHDAITQQGGVRLTDYASVIATADVKPFDPEESDLYEVLVEDDPDKRMPPPPNDPWPQENINAVYKWISQGAQDLYCDEEECDTTNVTYTSVVSGIIQMHCFGCHNNSNPLGGLSLEGYNNLVTVANDGRLMGVVTHEAGYPPMPKNAAKLSDCKILQLQTWINNGVPE